MTKKDKKKKCCKPKDDKDNGIDTEKEINEHPPYPDIRPRELREPLDQPEGPEDKEAI